MRRVFLTEVKKTLRCSGRLQVQSLRSPCPACWARLESSHDPSIHLIFPFCFPAPSFGRLWQILLVFLEIELQILYCSSVYISLCISILTKTCGHYTMDFMMTDGCKEWAICVLLVWAKEYCTSCRMWRSLWKWKPRRLRFILSWNTSSREVAHEMGHSTAVGMIVYLWSCSHTDDCSTHKQILPIYCGHAKAVCEIPKQIKSSHMAWISSLMCTDCYLRLSAYQWKKWWWALQQSTEIKSSLLKCPLRWI